MSDSVQEAWIKFQKQYEIVYDLIGVTTMSSSAKEIILRNLEGLYVTRKELMELLEFISEVEETDVKKKASKKSSPKA